MIAKKIHKKKGGVSALIPIYGAEKYIERCAISLFEQTYDDLEYIFVNDCTKDNSIGVLLSVLERYPQRKEQVRIINHEVNKGVGEARNTLLDAASKEFLLFVDPDDYIDVDLIEQLMAKQAETDADAVFYDCCIETTKGCKYVKAPEFENTDQYLIAYLRRELLGGILGKFIKTSLFNDNYIRVRCGITYSEDFLIFAQALYYSHKTTTIHGSYYHYETNNDSSLTHKFKDSHVEDQLIANDILHEFYEQIGGKYFQAHKYGTSNHICNLFFEASTNNSKKSFKILKQYMKDNMIQPYPLWKPMLYMPCWMAYTYYKVVAFVSSIKQHLKSRYY